MSDIVITRGFTGDDDDRLCVKIYSEDETEGTLTPFVTYHAFFYTITEHQHYYRCNDTWYPKVHDGADRMISDIQRDMGLSEAQVKEFERAIADLMIVGGL